MSADVSAVIGELSKDQEEEVEIIIRSEKGLIQKIIIFMKLVGNKRFIVNWDI